MASLSNRTYGLRYILVIWVLGQLGMTSKTTTWHPRFGMMLRKALSRARCLASVLRRRGSSTAITRIPNLAGQMTKPNAEAGSVFCVWASTVQQALTSVSRYRCSYTTCSSLELLEAA